MEKPYGIKPAVAPPMIPATRTTKPWRASVRRLTRPTKIEDSPARGGEAAHSTTLDQKLNVALSATVRGRE